MGAIRIFDTPIRADLIYNDTVVEVYTDDFGDHDVYEIYRVVWEERAGLTWILRAAHPATGKSVQRTIGPYESGSYNIPTPARFKSYPLRIGCTLVRA